MFKNFHKSFSEIQKEKSKFIEKINKILIEATIFYPEKVKEQKVKIAILKDLKKQKEKTNNDIVKAKSKNETETLNKLQVNKFSINLYF
jgi:hypothetical protein